MSIMGRRAFLGSMAATGAAFAVGAPRWASAVEPPLPGPPFTLGIASGDPLPNAVVLWTRLAPDPLNGGGMPAAAINVDWEVAADELFANVVVSGSLSAVAEHAHSVHVDATGLSPDTWYFYRFKAGGFISPVGHTRTAPASVASPSSMKLGFASCQSWTSGYYTAHTHLAQESLDAVFFLGDYIYE
ncbi:MAG: PhoD-like phosphatase N-terminal domain-containing protein, partial [Actinobacteria bacterium]|nr:PhoD-like phosphatase N-terminal domain-containing protein [Actinomycetota bacterium]